MQIGTVSERQADPIHGRSNGDVHIVQHERPMHINGDSVPRSNSRRYGGYPPNDSVFEAVQRMMRPRLGFLTCGIR